MGPARLRAIVLAAITACSPLLVSAAERPPAPLATTVTAAAGLAAGFDTDAVWSGLTDPTSIRFAADGRVVVAEKSGRVKIFESLDDPTPTTSTVLMTNVFDYWDRGLLGLALDPNLTGGAGTGSYVYVAYTYDHILGDANPAPRWGDRCPTPPGPTTDGCVASTRISRLPLNGTTLGAEQVLVEGWCQQFPSHSMGSLVFGPDGALYATHGDGANFAVVDYGQRGGTTNPIVTPRNPCGDPPGGVGGSMTPPTAQGGSLRSQDLRTSGDPVALNGSVIRINPATGASMPGSPFASSGDSNARRIVAYGLRNPFRAAFRPGTSELWVGDVGWEIWDELDLVPNASDGVAENFGWPCYEGAARQPAWDAANINICETLYASAGAVRTPVFAYQHGVDVVPGETCAEAGSALAGLAFYPTSGGSFPAAYAGGLFLADHSRSCIWFMPAGLNGRPDPAQVRSFYQGAPTPVDLTVGPDGNLYFVDFDGGAIRRISPSPANRRPVVVIQATPTYGPTPLTVDFDGSGSSDPEATALTYAWDLDGDGLFDDATGATAQHTYTEAGNVVAGLRVTDADGQSATATQVIGAGNTPPVPVMNAPGAGFTWHVGETVPFSGSATDDEDGALPGTSLTWSVSVRHCPISCHTHPAFFTSDGATGSFQAPDHSYPSTLLVRLTATDSAGVSVSVERELQPETVTLTFKTSPAGIALGFDSGSSPTPFTRTVIVGSWHSVSATTPVTVSGTTYAYKGWSDGGALSHDIQAPATARTYTATYALRRLIPARVDAFVRSTSPNTNFGAATYLRVRSDIARAYLKFDVTGLSARPASARLRLYVKEGGPSGGFVYKVGSGWVESTITWNNRPLVNGTSLSHLGGVATGTWVELDVTAAITGNGTYSFAILGVSDDAVDYASTETANDPVLVIVQ